MITLRERIAPYGRICVTGICKNAGKTTAFNRLISCCPGETLGLSSIGLDGEETDLVTHTPKPRVLLKPGTIFATAEGLAPQCRMAKTVLDLTDITTPLGRVAVMRADSPGCGVLAGPSVVAQMARVAASMEAFGAQRIFIDGALFRRSIAVTELSAAAVLCAGAAYHPDMERTAEHTAYLACLMTLPLYREEEGSRGGTLLLDGALTDLRAEELMRAKESRLVFSDPGKLLLGKGQWERLKRKGKEILVCARPALLFVAMNPVCPGGTGYDAAAFRRALTARLDVDVLDMEAL